MRFFREQGERKLADMIDKLRRMRADADYELERGTFNKVNAEEAIRMANSIVSLFDSLGLCY